MISKAEGKQKTIAGEVSLTGVGLHTGKNVTLTFKPADENNGMFFKRVDLEGQPIIEANADYVVNTQRGTNLEKSGVHICIELDASEPPIMDGSSKFFVEALEKVGLKEQEACREEYVVTEVISYVDEKSGSEIMLMPAEEYQLTTMVDFGTKMQVSKVSPSLKMKFQIQERSAFCTR